MNRSEAELRRELDRLKAQVRDLERTMRSRESDSSSRLFVGVWLAFCMLMMLFAILS